MNIVDQFHDTAFATLTACLQQTPNLYPFVKTASIEQGEYTQLPDTAFAWQSERRYPIHTPEHAALSKMYVKVATVDVPEYVNTAIDKACSVYCIPEESYTEVKTASAVDDVYAIPEERRWRMNTPEELSLAEEALVKHAKFIPVEEKTKIAVRIVKQANALGLPSTTPYTTKSAGIASCDKYTLLREIEKRAALTAGKHKTAYAKLADAVEADFPVTMLERDQLLKVAGTLSALDEAAGIMSKYHKQVADPVLTVFNGEKLAEDYVDLGGTPVASSKILALPEEFWTSLAGDDILSEIKDGDDISPVKLLTVVDTLPLDLKLVIKNQLGA